MFNVRSLFTREAIIRRLKNLPKLKTPVMDTVYSYRPQLGMAVVGSDMIEQVTQELPVVRRGGASIPVKGSSGSTSFYEPLAARPSDMVTGADINNLKVLGESSKEAWALQKTDSLRYICRKTAEAMAAVSLSGTLRWPVQLENGVLEDWEIVFGTNLSETPAKLFDAADAKVKDVFDLLTAMEEKLQDKGYGSNVITWAGKTAYSALYGLAEKVTSTAKIKVEVSEKGIDIGGYIVKRRSEKHYNPKTKTMVPTVPDNSIKMIDLDARMMMPYCALDDLDANLQPLPFFIKPVQISDPSGYKLIAESKPFPIPNCNAICDAVVTA
jgi:hypothetical protein